MRIIYDYDPEVDDPLVINENGVLKLFIPFSPPADDTLRLPDDVHTLGKNCFEPWDNGIMSVIFSFGAYEHSKKLVIPKNVKVITPPALIGLDFLEEAIVEEGNERFMTIDGALYTADGRTLLCWPAKKETGKDGIIILPEGVKCLEENAFLGAKARMVVLPEGLEKLCDDVFSGCSVGRVVIPKNVEFIGERCFTYNDEPMSVIVYKGSYAEEYCERNGVLHKTLDR